MVGDAVGPGRQRRPFLDRSLTTSGGPAPNVVAMLAFTAGVGEHSAALRERVCSALAWLGVDLDGDANRANAPVISKASSRVRVVVEPTNEEWIGAFHALPFVRGMS